MPLRHALLAITVMAIWGSNFVVIRSGLDHLPPLLFGALRFVFATVPAILFLPRPNVSWKNLASYGLLIGVGNFGLLYIAMDGHITPGLASVVVQTQVFFTIGLAMYLSGERIQRHQIVALSLAALGLGIILLHTDKTTTPAGLALVLGAALGWAGANTIVRATPKVDMLAFVVWASLFSAPPLIVLSLAFEGWDAIARSLLEAPTAAWVAVFWQSIANTLFGYAVWAWLLSRYPAATIAPMPLLVPLFGMAASAAWLGEGLPLWKILAAALVISGLGLNLLWPRLAARLQWERAPN